MQGRPGRVGTEGAGGPGRMGAGRAQALERDLSSVRLCDAEDGGSATEGGRCFGWPSVTLRDLRLPWANNLGLIGFLPL